MMVKKTKEKRGKKGKYEENGIHEDGVMGHELFFSLIFCSMHDARHNGAKHQYGY